MNNSPIKHIGLFKVIGNNISESIGNVAIIYLYEELKMFSSN